MKSQQRNIMANCTVTCSADGLKAFLQVTLAPREEYPAWQELQRSLLDHGVVWGINEEILQKMAAERLCNIAIEVAQGLPPGPSTPGRWEKLVDTSGRGKPRVMEGGKVDHRDLNYVINVTKGTPILRRIPPSKGDDGMSVQGTKIEAEPPIDVALPLRKGTETSPQDPDLLIAAIDGALEVFADGSIGVKNDRIIDGDIDYQTGNIRFNGDLRIKGSVRAGFKVETAGDLVIDGAVEDAQVICGGELAIQNGAVGGGRGCIKSAGSIRARRLERFTVESAGDVTVIEDAILVQLQAKGSVRARTIVGGVVAANVSIEAGEVGAEAGTKTCIQIKGVQELEERRHECLRELARTANALGEAKQSLFVYVRDTMDPAGLLDAFAQTRLIELHEQCRQRANRRRELEKMIGEVNKEIAGRPRGFIRVGTAYPGVIMKFGSYEKVLNERVQKVEFSMDGNRLNVVPW